MATDVMTLREFVDQLDTLAEEWEGEQPAVLIGDVHGNVSVRDKGGYSAYGPVGFAHECFDSNGVWELGQQADRRFFGTMLIDQDDLGKETREQLQSNDYCAGGDPDA